MQQLGQIIQAKRIDRSLDIEDVAEKLKISKRHIKAIEGGRLESFSSGAYYHGYLKQYLKFLQIEDIVLESQTTQAELNICKPIIAQFEPSFLLVVFSIIVSIIIYYLCSELIDTNSINPIALELKDSASKLAKI